MRQSYLGKKEGLRRILASCISGTIDIARNIANKKKAHKKPGSNNLIKESLVDRSKIFPPPFYMKLDLMMQFVKALDKEGDCFNYTEKNLVEMLHYLWCSCATALEGNCSALHRLAGLLFCGLTAFPQLRESCCPTGGNAAASHIN